ncbi:MAG: hypothetical protein Q9179_000886 [Wetmoreana sp. 5 TL-2023]
MKPADTSIGWIVFLLSLPLTAFAQENSGLKTTTYKGCFSSADGFKDLGDYTYQSPGYCQQKCVSLNKPVMGLAGGSNCWCGDLLPLASNKVSDSECSGGSNAWTIFLTGLNSNVGSAQDTSSGSKPTPKPATSATPPAPATTLTTSIPAAKSKPTGAVAAAVAQPDSTKEKQPATLVSTVVVTGPTKTQAAPASGKSQEPSKGPNTAGIAAGVVVGVVAICGIVGALLFILRRRKRRAAEQEYQSNNINPFEPEAPRPPPSSSSMSDSRLEPSVMMQRRQSDGSIADNQDYSRRILKVDNLSSTQPILLLTSNKVTNPDGS